MKAQWPILVVGGDEVTCDTLVNRLRDDGHTVHTASGRDAVDKARTREYAIYLVDGCSDMVNQIRRVQPEASIIALAAPGAIYDAVAAMIRLKNLERENGILRKTLQRRYCVHDIIGKNPCIREIVGLACNVASLPGTVLIHGEPGTGKEMLARVIHYSGARAGKPFIPVHCARIPEIVLESDLFGHEQSAFPGAFQQKDGKIRICDGGTIFLDEIGELPLTLQSHLLGFLRDGRFCRVGGQKQVRADVRVIAATRTNLRQAVAEGKYRDDLFSARDTIEIRIPPLRDRREDIPMLAASFLERFSHELGKEIDEISDAAMKVLMDCDWPGNVRELENALERAMLTCRGRKLTEDDFSFLSEDSSPKPWTAPPGTTLNEMEKLMIAATLQRTGGNIKESASILGIDRSTLYEKIKRYSIPR